MASRQWHSVCRLCATMCAPALREGIKADTARSHCQRDLLAAIARSLEATPPGDRNIWLRAILDGADNDASTIAAGPSRDTALNGALRKGKQAERVSYKTALSWRGDWPCRMRWKR